MHQLVCTIRIHALEICRNMDPYGAGRRAELLRALTCLRARVWRVRGWRGWGGLGADNGMAVGY